MLSSLKRAAALTTVAGALVAAVPVASANAAPLPTLPTAGQFCFTAGLTGLGPLGAYGPLGPHGPLGSGASAPACPTMADLGPDGPLGPHGALAPTVP
jgi:hypothetical protein